MKPVVTAIIPCHNHEKWITEAINSIALQDYPHKRIVVVENGSKDNSKESILSTITCITERKEQKEPWICKGLVKSNPGVELLLCSFKDGLGPSKARNYGIKTAWDGTDIFALLDSDDYYKQGKISKSVEQIIEDKNVGMVYSDFDTVNDNGLLVREYKEPFSRHRLLQECIVNADSLITKKAFETVGLFDESFRVCEDFDTWLRISEKFLIIHIPESLITIRVGSHSSTSTVDKKIWQENYSRVINNAKLRAQQRI